MIGVVGNLEPRMGIRFATLSEIPSNHKTIMSRLRILLLAPGCNPEEASMPYVTYSHAAALAQLHDVALVIGSPTEDPVRRAKAPFRAIEVVRMPFLVA